MLVVALQLWDMFTTVFNRTVGMKNCIDARLSLHSLFAEVALDIYNDGHAGTGLTRKLPKSDSASVAEEVERRVAEARPLLFCTRCRFPAARLRHALTTIPMPRCRSR